MAESHSHSHDHSHDHSHEETAAHLWQATSESSSPPDAWKSSGVRVIPGNQLDGNTPQTPGMNRAAAITAARTGAQKLWAGTVTIHPQAKTGAHHHGHLESVIYVVRGKARMRWGSSLEFTAEAGPGDFIYVPPWVPHQEINAGEAGEALECVLMRSDDSAIAVNLPDVKPVEDPEGVLWVDPTHPGEVYRKQAESKGVRYNVGERSLGMRGCMGCGGSKVVRLGRFYDNLLLELSTLLR